MNSPSLTGVGYIAARNASNLRYSPLARFYWLFTTFCTCSLAGVLTIILLYVIPSELDAVGRQLIVLAVIVHSILLSHALGRLLKRDRIDIFEPPVFWGLYNCIAIIRFVQLAGEDQWRLNPPIFSGEEVVGPLATKALLFLAIHFASFLCGYNLFSFARSERSFAQEARTWNRAKLRTAVFALLLLGIASYIAVISLGGGLSGYINSMGRRREILTGNAYLMNFAFAGLFGASFIYYVYSQTVKRSPTRVLALLFLLVSSLLLLLLGNRSDLVSIVLFALVVYHYAKKHLRVGLVLATGLVLFYVIYFFGVARKQTASTGSFAVSNQATQKQPKNSDSLNPLNVMGNHMRDRGGVDALIVFVEGVPERVPFQYFTTLSGLVLNLVPRAIYEDKPGLTEANWYRSLYGQYEENFATKPAGAAADYYLQMGIFSLVLMSLLQGVVQKWFYVYVTASPQKEIAAAAYALGLVYLGRGLDNLNVMTFLLKGLPVILLIRYLTETRAVMRRMVPIPTARLAVSKARASLRSRL